MVVKLDLNGVQSQLDFVLELNKTKQVILARSEGTYEVRIP